MADGIYDYNSTEGIIVPDTSEIKAGVEDEFREALGSDLSLEGSTPQGRLIAAETRARTAVMHNNAAMANLINPAEAYGVYLDALCALTGISRRTAQPTTVTGVRLYGTNGTVVPAGSPGSPSAKTEDGDYFYLASDVVINVSDGEGHYYGTGTFISCETGPVPCGAGKLNEIAEDTEGTTYIFGQAEGVHGEKHWIVLTGYSLNESGQVQFNYSASSVNDEKQNRKYILGEKTNNQGNFYTITKIETYTLIKS